MPNVCLNPAILDSKGSTYIMPYLEPFLTSNVMIQADILHGIYFHEAIDVIRRIMIQTAMRRRAPIIKEAITQYKTEQKTIVMGGHGDLTDDNNACYSTVECFLECFIYINFSEVITKRHIVKHILRINVAQLLSEEYGK